MKHSSKRTLSCCTVRNSSSVRADHCRRSTGPPSARHSRSRGYGSGSLGRLSRDWRWRIPSWASLRACGHGRRAPILGRYFTTPDLQSGEKSLHRISSHNPAFGLGFARGLDGDGSRALWHAAPARRKTGGIQDQAAIERSRCPDRSDDSATNRFARAEVFHDCTVSARNPSDLARSRTCSAASVKRGDRIRCDRIRNRADGIRN